ncbi:trypsin-like serine protease [Pseudolysobacter antarcticus]|uniref:Trypsin-like serine protease n=1 Tax=Pseudolysobacter antarcticus TaxID=2511995 RepID=A0A411HPE8_9GAMM|nr:trypsin-like peptidase domain-containing protein [Pseudolysobacter antarcticus]QBB72371.1 trypsin-like serine protease [Pseudolysobacter antarcticus]
MVRLSKTYGRLLFVASMVCTAALAHAGAYKWKDAQGNWQFSDTPPPTGGASDGRGDVQQVALSNDFADVKVANKPPIANTRRNGGPSIALDNFTLRLDVANGNNTNIGRAFSGKNCAQSTGVQWEDGIVDLKGKVAEQTVAERFRNFGYSFAGVESENIAALATLHLDAELLAMKMDTCDSISMGNALGPGSRAYIKIRWTLRRNVADEPLFRGISVGAFDAWHPGGMTKGVILKALGNATDNLLGDHAFVDILTGTSPERASAFNPVDVKLVVVRGDGGGTFRGNSESLLRSAVTVRTARGHGSGVLIDASGYALTNAHVVGSNTQVQVMLDDEMVDARVVRSDSRVDVALLQFEPKGRPAAIISRSEPRPGDPLYVVGTPLDLKLSHSVTQGILSAVREVNGARLYQTDAAVNPGNSGGPVFNDTGELVALSVSGLVNADGASLNVNYLIPISRALAAVGANGD